MTDPHRSSSSSDEEMLSLSNEKLDVIKCLYSDKTNIPNKSAPVLDNLTKFVVNEDNEIEIRQTILKPKLPEASTYERAKIKSTLTPKIQKIRKNILTKLNKINKGPLFGLKNCMLNKTRVKIYTRNHSSIRGFCTGIIIAFDKHWNIALKNVCEVWTRPKKQLKSIYSDLSGNNYKIQHEVNIPKVDKIESDKNSEKLERRVGQLLIRGEHIVSVCALNYKEL